MLQNILRFGTRPSSLPLEYWVVFAFDFCGRKRVCRMSPFGKLSMFWYSWSIKWSRMHHGFSLSPVELPASLKWEGSESFKLSLASLIQLPIGLSFQPSLPIHFQKLYYLFMTQSSRNNMHLTWTCNCYPVNYSVKSHRRGWLSLKFLLKSRQRRTALDKFIN